ncbi:MbtH family protein [Streptomyces griseus]|nr:MULTISPECIES: MbtH family NRPS accessory protein [Streptomyces]MYR11621.1 MbtH family NRPS accessory protein [Streptomyces sp. SID724]MYR50234.1 MbtH family NRPS accessory protein [Streptomyces sp. SID4928]MYT80901.1 MbtH family NRPS accessory protein [Streptomyces sp. SID8364]EGE42186.1 MbtH domain protein [Streptomyces sp. ACT-1]MBW3705057.1 MbtH family protein [Streptomyces griseus]
MSSDTLQYRVVVNAEEQYSVWFLERPLPTGWTETGTTGTREACLAHIAEVWTDLTPRSVRERRGSVAA